MTRADGSRPTEGRPKLYKSAKEMQVKIDEYFDHCDNRIKQIYTKEGAEIAMIHPEPYTMSGLANALGMDRQSLLNYSKTDEFFGTIKAARSKVHQDVEVRLMETSNQAGAIFNLKNNFGWKDKTETESKSEVTHKWEDMTDEQLDQAIKAREDREA